MKNGHHSSENSGKFLPFGGLIQACTGIGNTDSKTSTILYELQDMQTAVV